MYSRIEIEEELKYFYNTLEFEKKFGKSYDDSSDEEINKFFQQHCDEYKQEIQIGDLFKDSFNHEFLINSPDGFVETGDLYIKGPYPIYTVKTPEFCLKCSKGHLIETIEGWKDVVELKETDSILTKKGYQDISYIREGASEDVYDLEVLHKNHRYWGGTGISSHNTGKSFLAVSSCREAQKQGWTPIYLDSENSMSPEFVSRLGCDPKNFIIKQVSTVKEVTTFIINLCKSFEEQGVTFPKVFLVLDSLGNLTSDKELGDSIEGKSARDMTRAQEVKALFRVVTTPLARLQIPLICINHVYASMSFMGGFSQASGCLAPSEKIQTSEGIKCMSEIKIGDKVLSHDNEYHIVEKVWNHRKKSYVVTFENGTNITCSETHRFLFASQTPIKSLDSWKIVTELVPGDFVYKLRNGSLQSIEIKSIELIKDELDVIDLTVQDTHNYVSANGIINHNSGIQYSSSITIQLSAAKLEDKNNDKAAADKKGAFTKNGVLITAKPIKSRYCIPQKVKFQIPFFCKPNPYVGLEQYLTWENSKIIRGEALDEKGYLKLSPAEQMKCLPFEDGDFKCWVFPKDTSRKMFVGHLHEAVPILEFFTDRVFTEEFLKQIDETVIRPAFELPSQDSFEDIKELEEAMGVGEDIPMPNIED